MSSFYNGFELKLSFLFTIQGYEKSMPNIFYVRLTNLLECQWTANQQFGLPMRLICSKNTYIVKVYCEKQNKGSINLNETKNPN